MAARRYGRVRRKLDPQRGGPVSRQLLHDGRGVLTFDRIGPRALFVDLTTGKVLRPHQTPVDDEVPVMADADAHAGAGLLLLGEPGRTARVAFAAVVLIVPKVARKRNAAQREITGGMVVLEFGFDPLPAGGPFRLGDGIELVDCKLQQQAAIGEEALILVIEQVASNGPSRRSIGVQPDEAGKPVARFHGPLGKSTANGTRGQKTAPSVMPDPELRLTVFAHREGHQAIEVDVAFAKGRDQFRMHARELEALLDEGRLDAEALRDLRYAQPPVGDERMKRLKLVGGMHGDPHHVFGEGDFTSILGLGEHAAGHRIIPRQVLRPRKLLERPQPPAPGDDLKAPILDGPHVQVLAQAVGADAGGELADTIADSSAADIGLALHKQAQRDGGGVGHHGHGRSPFSVVAKQHCAAASRSRETGGLEGENRLRGGPSARRSAVVSHVVV